MIKEKKSKDNSCFFKQLMKIDENQKKNRAFLQLFLYGKNIHTHLSFNLYQ